MITRKVIPAGVFVGTALLPFLATNVSADTVTDTLNNAKSLQSYFQDHYQAISNAKPASSAMAAAQSTLADDIVVLNSISRNNPTSYSSTIKVSKTWINAYQRYLNASSFSQQNDAENILSSIAPIEADNNKFIGTGLDTKKMYDPSNLPVDELTKLNLYFTGLINSLHTQLGDCQTTYANQNAMAFATDVARGYQNNNYLANIDHNIPIINSAAIQHGLRANSMMNMYENVTEAYVTSIPHKQFTEQELYQMVYNSTLNLTINDVYSNFNHLKSLLSVPTMGLSFSTVTDSNNWTYTQMQIEGIHDADQLTSPNQYDNMYGIASTNTFKPNGSQAAAQMAYNSASISASTAASAYSSAVDTYSYEVSLAAISLNSANESLRSAQAAYDMAQQSSASNPASSSSNSASSSASSTTSSAIDDNTLSSIASAQSSLASYQSSIAASIAASSAAFASSVAAQQSMENSIASSMASYQSSLASSMASYQSSVAASIASSEAAQQNSQSDSGTNTFVHPIVAHLYIEAHIDIIND